MKELRWQTPEFLHHDKGLRWYTILAAIAGILILIALWRGNFLFVLFILFAGITMALLGSKSPRNLTFVLTEEQFSISGDRIYPLRDFAHFSLSAPDEPMRSLSELVLDRHGMLPSLHIWIASEDIEKIREILQNILPETPYQESFVDHLSRLLRF